MSRLTLGDGGFICGDRSVPIVAAELPYTRLGPGKLDEALETVTRLGFSMVVLPMPWAVHAQEGFNGHLAVGPVVDACHTKGLEVIIDPGPCIRHQPDLAIPRAVLEDDATHARNGQGQTVWLPLPPRMTPAVSYAAPAFRSRAEEWFRTLAGHLGQRAQSVALRLTVPPCEWYRDGPFDTDYHDAVLNKWGDRLDAPPPNSFDDPKLALQWMQFQRDVSVGNLRWLGTALDRCGFGGAPRIIHSPGNAVPMAGTAGAPSHTFRRRDPRGRLRHALISAGSHTVPIAHIDIADEPWLPGSQDAMAACVTAMGCGTRGLIVSGVFPEPGSAVTIPASHLSELLRVFVDHRWNELRTKPVVAIALDTVSRWLSDASRVLPAIPSWAAAALGLADGLATDPTPRQSAAFEHTIEDALRRGNIPYTIIESTTPPAECKLAIQVCSGTVDGDHWNAVRDFGGTVVVGPTLPTRDVAGQRVVQGRVGQFTADALANQDALTNALRGAIGEAASLAIPNCTVLYREGKPAVVALMPTDSDDQSVTLPSGLSLVDVLSGERFGDGEGPLHPRADKPRLLWIRG